MINPIPTHDRFDVALVWVTVFWLIWAGGCFRAKLDGTYDPVEAKAMAILTANFSLGVLSFGLHWLIAVGCFSNGFVMYFWAQSFFRNRGS